MNALQPIQTSKPTIESLTKAIVAQVDVLGLPTFQGAPMRPSYQTDPNKGAIWVTWNGGANDYHIATVTERADGRLAITVYVETGEGNKHSISAGMAARLALPPSSLSIRSLSLSVAGKTPMPGAQRARWQMPKWKRGSLPVKVAFSITASCTGRPEPTSGWLP